MAVNARSHDNIEDTILPRSQVVVFSHVRRKLENLGTWSNITYTRLHFVQARSTLLSPPASIMQQATNVANHTQKSSTGSTTMYYHSAKGLATSPAF